jgi:hypothetical protein
LVKIDVEGAEQKVLEGASEVLRQVRPVFIIEVGDENLESVGEIFKSQGYGLYDAASFPNCRARISRCAYNTIAMPIRL